VVILLAVTAMPVSRASAQPGRTGPVEWWPGATYDASIPTPESVLGYPLGADFTEHLAMVDYMRRLEATSSRVKVFSVGQSIERRELLLVAISSPEHIAELEAIRTRIAELRDPRVTATTRAAEIAASTPAVAWMSFANDGNESAAFETAIQLAYHLTAGTDEATRRILDDLVTIIYPAHNPESHSRYVAWMKASATGNPDPQAQEHRGDWRMDTNNNHYQIDLNRDAVALTQPETRVIVREIHRWNPVVYIDHHGNPDRFFFPPWALPVNPQVDQSARDAVKRYGRAIAAAFDRSGWTYYTHRVFDLHFPGYFDSYPTLNGAIGMTFETDGGGNKGLAYRLPDDRITTLFDGILHHFTAAFATLLTTADQRAARLQALYDFRATALEEAAGDAAQYVLLPGEGSSRTGELVGLLLDHHVEVHRARSAFESRAAHDYLSGDVGPREFPAGAFVVRTDQPQARLLRTIMDPDTPLQPEFLEDVRAAERYNRSIGRDAPKKDYGFYDINAWSLPLAFGIEAAWTEDRVSSDLERVLERPVPTVQAPARGRVGYLFAWAGSASLVSALWDADYRVSLAREPFVVDGQRFGPMTVVVRSQPNPDSLHDALATLAVEHGVVVTAVDSALVDEGRDLGDPSVVDLKTPRIAVLTEEPTSPTAFGAIWYLLERVHRVPFTALLGRDVRTADLERYNVIVLPDGRGYARLFGDDEVDKLTAWVERGGTLVAVKSAAVWASGDKVGLTTARDKFAPRDEEEEQDDESDDDAADADEEEPWRMEPIPGAFVRLDVDTEHYLAAGLPAMTAALFRSDVAFGPTERGARVATIDKDDPIVSGFAFDESRNAIRGGGFLWNETREKGQVTLFADDVTFRAFMPGPIRFFLNAVLLGPTFAEGSESSW
jgi:hypothetical protein